MTRLRLIPPPPPPQVFFSRRCSPRGQAREGRAGSLVWHKAAPGRKIVNASLRCGAAPNEARSAFTPMIFDLWPPTEHLSVTNAEPAALPGRTRPARAAASPHLNLLINANVRWRGPRSCIMQLSIFVAPAICPPPPDPRRCFLFDCGSLSRSLVPLPAN